MFSIKQNKRFAIISGMRSINRHRMASSSRPIVKSEEKRNGRGRFLNCFQRLRLMTGFASLALQSVMGEVA